MTPLRLRYGRILRQLRTHFLAGILIIVPIGITALILVWLFNNIDGVLQPIIHLIWGRQIPGVGFGVTLLLIYLAGVIASNIIGNKIVVWAESVVDRIPMVRQLYQGIKQILSSFSATREKGFLEVVFVEFPKKGMKSVGFVTNETKSETGEKIFNVYVPTAPNPTGGFLLIVGEEEIIRTKMSVEEAFRLIVSAGKYSAKHLTSTVEPRVKPE